MANRSWRISLLAMIASTALAGCLPEPTARMSAPSAPAEEAPNRPPTISGTPPSNAIVGSAYSFHPTASDPEGQTLSYTIANKPANAEFSTVTGALTWTPTSAGSWANIVISVTDSDNASASLPAFSIAVTQPAPTGSAVLSWAPPTQYTDGSPLAASELVAYRIYYGTALPTLTRFAEVDGRAMTFTVQNLDAGTHYFAVTAVSPSGMESALSIVGSKTIQ